LDRRDKEERSGLWTLLPLIARNSTWNNAPAVRTLHQNANQRRHSIFLSLLKRSNHQMRTSKR
jgi:hypothetical protein